MNSLLLNISAKNGSWSFYRGVYTFFLVGLLCASLSATGTPDLHQPGEAPVMLLIGDGNFGNFARYGAPETNQLRVRVGDAAETIYLGLARAYRYDGTPKLTGAYYYRVRRVADGEIVHGPTLVNTQNANLNTYEDAVLGPEEITPGGYATTDEFKLTGLEPGDYAIEFSGQLRYLGLWDITVGKDGQELPGRVYSQNWAFRVPVIESELPDCVWGATLSTKFYSYTSDGFVTQIDFADSGFQPLSFNLAFNRTGPGESGDLQLDRMSIPNLNATAAGAEHYIFINSPDPVEFPDGNCGSVAIEDQFQCAGDGFCIPVSVTAPGQVDVILDFNGNQVFDDGIDRILVQTFQEGDEFEACLYWDGIRGDGNLPDDGQTVNIVLNYTQGVQHWALFDGEKMNDGFCVTPVRPICNGGGNAMLFYDDRNITDESGTSSPNDGRQGCDCATPACRTWKNFDASTNDCSDIDDNLTSGYGDKNTLNTWWFASSQTLTSLDVPTSLATINGPIDFCPEDEIQLTVDYYSDQPVEALIWEGPNGFSAAGDTNILVTTPGLYAVTITDDLGCTATASFALMEVTCDISAEVIGITCNNNGTDTNANDDYFTAEILVSGGSNSSSWVSTNSSLSGEYGTTLQLGPFFINGGDVSLILQDAAYDCCLEEILLEAPLPCSDGCAISEVLIQNRLCDDGGTPADPSDDSFTFELLLDGINLSDGWVAENGEQGLYGEPTQFGPFPISAGVQTLNVSDNGDAECTVSVVVEPPLSCSNQCVFSIEVTNVYCEDNGTNTNPFDDVYYFDFVATSVNGTNSAFEINDGAIGLYGLSQQIGPLNIADGNFMLTLTDIVDGECSQTIEVIAPATCSNHCGIEIASIAPRCNDNGTLDDFSDDVFYYDIVVLSESDANTTWIASDGTVGEYGVLTQSVAHPNLNGPLLISVTDATNPICADTAWLELPMPVISCPENEVDVVTRLLPLNHITGGLVNQRNYFEPEIDLSCWLDEEELIPGGRFYDRFSFHYEAPIEAGPELFTFYLFEELIDTNTIGAVFNIGELDSIECCVLVNEGPIQAWNPEDLTEPFLPDSLLPDSMRMTQQFTLLLRPQEDYTVVTTTWSLDTFGNYQWIILSGSGEVIQTTSTNVQLWQEHNIALNYELNSNHLINFLNGVDEAGAFEQPQLAGGCIVADLIVNDTIIGDSCNELSLIRSYDLLYQDDLLTEVCTQTFHFDQWSVEDVIFPQQSYKFGCTDTFPALPNGNPSPAFTGYPAVNDMGSAIILDDNWNEDLLVSYQDRDSFRLDGGRDVYREWTVVNECSLEDTSFTQIFCLEVGGNLELSCPITNHYCPILGEDIMVFTTEAFSCFADVAIPLPDLLNSCTPQEWEILTRVYRLDTLLDGTVDTIDLLFLEAGDDRLWENVVVADYFVEYIATHPVEDTVYQTCRFRVADLNEPTPICRSLVNISLPGSGVHRLFTQNIDQGSYDNCDNFNLSIRRSFLHDATSCVQLDSVHWSEWADFVDFSCCDVGDLLTVQLRIIDAAGNSNYCESIVEVNDHSLPYCTGLENLTISCDDLPDGFNPEDTVALSDWFGFPVVIDNCAAYANELPPIISGDNCTPEQIVRRFQAVDQHGNLASSIFTQTITVLPSLSYNIRFPADTETNCIDNADTLRVEMTGCDDITVGVVNSFLALEGDECLRIARTYVVTNHCEWDGSSEAVNVPRDINCDGVGGDMAIWVLRRNDTTFYDQDSLAYNNLPLPNASQCPGGNPAGYWDTIAATGRWTYTQIIAIYDEVAPELNVVYNDSICLDSLACEKDFNMEITVLDACNLQEEEVNVSIDLNADGSFDESFSTLDPQLNGGAASYVFNHQLPIGNHLIRVTATDPCGNQVVEDYPVSIFDCYVPELQCLDFEIYNLEALGEPTDIDNDGVLEEAAAYIDASELGNCIFEDCSGDLIYTINRPGDLPEIAQTGIYLDCDDRYQVDLELYVWDNAANPFSLQPDGSIGGRNWRRCNLTVFLQDPDQACNSCTQEESLITIGGSALGIAQQFLPNVMVEVEETGETTGTNGNGRFTLLVESGANYTVRASKNDDVPAGISTLDVLLLRAHILQQQTITNPYQLLAADINADGAIDVMDAVALQAVVLGTSLEFPNNSSWRFVPASWNGEGTAPVGITFNDLQSCAFDAQLVGVKVGDLSGSLTPNTNSFVDGGENRSATQETLWLNDQVLTKGMTIKVAISLPSSVEFAGGQSSWRWQENALELLSYNSETIGANNINDYSVERGLLSFNYFATLLAKNELILTFQVKTAGKLSDFLQLDPAGLLVNEVYRNGSFDPAQLDLKWTAPVHAPTVAPPSVMAQHADDVVYTAQVVPNPVVREAQLLLQATTTASGTMVITDLNGRIVRKQQLAVKAGENSYTLAVNELSAGAYTYAVFLEGEVLRGVFVKR